MTSLRDSAEIAAEHIHHRGLCDQCWRERPVYDRRGRRKSFICEECAAQACSMFRDARSPQRRRHTHEGS